MRLADGDLIERLDTRADRLECEIPIVLPAGLTKVCLVFIDLATGLAFPGKYMEFIAHSIAHVSRIATLGNKLQAQWEMPRGMAPGQYAAVFDCSDMTIKLRSIVPSDSGGYKWAKPESYMRSAGGMRGIGYYSVNRTNPGASHTAIKAQNLVGADKLVVKASRKKAAGNSKQSKLDKGKGRELLSEDE
jgi:hypothetical protein